MGLVTSWQIRNDLKKTDLQSIEPKRDLMTDIREGPTFGPKFDG